MDFKEGGKSVAVKISKNVKSEVENAAIEAKLLKQILGKDPDKHGVVKMIDNFKFRNHYIITFELLGINLFKFIKQPSFRGLKRDKLRHIASQMLISLQHLRKISIIHCDLKPENVLFTDSTCSNVKIIDFGSACTEFKSGF